jgi:hypothetical protein
VAVILCSPTPAVSCFHSLFSVFALWWCVLFRSVRRFLFCFCFYCLFLIIVLSCSVSFLLRSVCPFSFCFRCYFFDFILFVFVFQIWSLNSFLDLLWGVGLEVR